jgi:FkbM family methyltransferase
MSAESTHAASKWPQSKILLRQLSSLLRYSITSPRFAMQLVRCRLDFRRTRKVPRPCVDPQGFVINSPETLFAWWALFIERQLVHPLWQRPLQGAQAPLIIDVGANAGVFMHLVFSINPGARVIAVEPQPELVKLLEDYGRVHHRHVQCVAAACSNREGSATLFFDHTGDLRASLDENFSVEKRKITVPVTTLDRIAPKEDIFVIKIDAEGHDLEVLQGAKEALARTRFVMLECHKPETLEQAKAILGGFDCQNVGRPDFLFYRPATAA